MREKVLKNIIGKILLCMILLTAGIMLFHTSAKAKEQAQVTLMVYIVGSDLESEDGQASLDIEEMLGTGAGDRVRVIIQTGGAESWDRPEISADTCQRFEISGNRLVQLQNIGSRNMADSKTLSDFIQFAAAEAPAERYMIVLWNHGGGTLGGFGYDECYDDMMDLADVDEGLTQGGVHFDMIGFDACLMATVENAFMLEKHGNYLVASEESEVGEGWDYSVWLKKLCEDPAMNTEQLGRVIADSYFESAGEYEKVTLSVVDLTKISAVYDSLCGYLQESAKLLIENNDFASLSKIRAGLREFGDGEFDQVDIVDYLKHTGNVDYEAVQAAVDSCVVYESGNIAEANGLAMYFPYSETDYYSNTLNVLGDIDMSDAYTGFFNSFVSIQSSGQSFMDLTDESWFDSDAAGAYDYFDDTDYSELEITEKGDDYVLHLTDEQWEQITGVELEILYDDGEGYFDLGADSLYEFDEDRDLVINFDGYWLSIDDWLCAYYVEYYEEYDDGTWESYGYVPCSINGEDQELLIYWGDEVPDGIIIGYRDVYEDTFYASGTIYDLYDGDVIQLYADYYTYDGEYDGEYYISDEIIYSDLDTTLDYSYIEEECIIDYKITDIYLNTYWTESLVVY